MARNLKYQFKYAIEQNFTPGMSKHSAKGKKMTGSNLIFSYADRKNLLSLSASFANFIQKYHSEIKMARDIQPSHIEEFLENSSKKCSDNTLSLYTSNFKKINKCINATYKINKEWKFKTPKGYSEYLRNKPMSDKDFFILLNSCQVGSTTYNALFLAKNFGCRVASLSKIRGSDIILEKNRIDGTVNAYLHIVDDKGRRSRIAACASKEEKDLEYLKYLQSLGAKRIIPIRPKSINQNIRRHWMACNLDYKHNHCHAIRKNYAQKLFDVCRQNKGYSTKKALDYVSKNLGHGCNRQDVTKIYLSKVY